MPRYDFTTHRLFVEAPLSAGCRTTLDRDQTNYLMNVLRMRPGDQVLIFNGRDGEWRASLTDAGRKGAILIPAERTRPQTARSELHYFFAPLKQARLDYMVQKAVEMGAGVLTPVLTRRTQVRTVNRERVRANAIEAAEQCGILSLPEIGGTTTLDDLLRDWPANRHLVFCDEDAPVRDPLPALAGLEAPAALIIGPEGGFEESEREAILRVPGVLRLSLGPRILRADTAAVAALALIQAALGEKAEGEP